jgi:hypothetical protein
MASPGPVSCGLATDREGIARPGGGILGREDEEGGLVLCGETIQTLIHKAENMDFTILKPTTKHNVYLKWVVMKHILHTNGIEKKKF